VRSFPSEYYWNRLEYLEKFPLLQNVYKQSKQLYNQNKSSWYGSLQRILQNFSTISQLKGKKIKKNSLNRQIKEGFLEVWKNQMKQYSEGKLRTYITFKVHFGFENYLSVIGNFYVDFVIKIEAVLFSYLNYLQYL
jgi:hypothetical protein